MWPILLIPHAVILICYKLTRLDLAGGSHTIGGMFFLARCWPGLCLCLSIKTMATDSEKHGT